MSGKIYSKNLTFLQDQPFAEKLLTGLSTKKKGTPPLGAMSSTRDSFLQKSWINRDINSIISTQSFTFCHNRVRSKSEKMKKAEASLIKHFCLILERTVVLSTKNSELFLKFSKEDNDISATNLAKLSSRSENQNQRVPNTSLITCSCNRPKVDSGFGFKAGDIIPHLLVSVDSMRNTLLATRGSRSSERVKNPSPFKKTLRECRKIRLLYGNLSRRHLSRATSKMHLSGENLLLWLESRLDVVLQRCGFFNSIKAARQSVLNGKITVNSKVIRSPGFLLEGGDLIKVIQERWSLDYKNKHLYRGVILSNNVFPSLARNSSLGVPTPIFGGSRYNSFCSWLQKKQEGYSYTVECLGHRNKVLYSAINWRFVGSPHLLFLFSFLHAHLIDFLFLFTEALNKDILIDKKVKKQTQTRARTQQSCVYRCAAPYNTQNRYTSGLRVFKETPRFLTNDSPAFFRGFFSFPPTITSVSNLCGVNPLPLKIVSRLSPAVTERTELTSFTKIDLFFKTFSKYFQRSNNRVFTSPEVKERFFRKKSSTAGFYFALEENSSGRVVAESYNSIFTRLSPACFSKEVSLFRDENNSLINDRSLTLTSFVKRKDRFLLCALLSDLLLYSLFIKKEVVSAPLKKQQLPSQGFSQVEGFSSSPSRARVTFNSNRVAVDKESHVKPLHLEVSYRTLCAIFLYPPQRVCLPVMIDVDCLTKSL